MHLVFANLDKDECRTNLRKDQTSRDEEIDDKEVVDGKQEAKCEEEYTSTEEEC